MPPDETPSHARAAVVVTVSDGVSHGVREDTSGGAVADLLERSGYRVVGRELVADERADIEALLRTLADAGEAGLVATTGGTGFGPRDVTPEATRGVIDREAPGLAERMRSAGREMTPLADLSRGVAGTRGTTLILNLPGSPKGAVESLEAVLPVLGHAVELLGGRTAHGPGDAATTAPPPAGEGTAPQGSVEYELVARRAAGEPVVLATAIRAEGNPPCRVGQKLLLSADGPIAGTLGCAEFDAGALDAAREALNAGEPRTVELRHELGSVEVYVEPSLRRPLLIAFAATPVSAALTRWAREMGFDTVVVESRAERPADAGRWGRVEASIPPIPEGTTVFAVHTDHDAPGVADALAAMLRADAAFVGVMGSARHVGPHVDELRSRGFSDAELTRVRTPVGLDIGARTAEEIALSILAGVVAARHGHAGGWLDAP
jgi:molybdenum cofactor synthesis domain-containing protein